MFWPCGRGPRGRGSGFERTWSLPGFHRARSVEAVAVDATRPESPSLQNEGRDARDRKPAVREQGHRPGPAQPPRSHDEKRTASTAGKSSPRRDRGASHSHIAPASAAPHRTYHTILKVQSSGASTAGPARHRRTRSPQHRGSSHPGTSARAAAAAVVGHLTQVRASMT